MTVNCVDPLLGFGFGNLAMLGWLAAAAAPLLIHLWSRRRYREVPWAAVTFLMAAIRKHSRRIQLQQWLLLAVRTLIILLVVLAVAEPYGGELTAGTSAPTHKLLLIDTSFSMACRDTEASRLARVKQLAAEIVDESGPGDAFTIVTLADPPRQLVGRDVADRTIVAGQIEAITQSHGRANLSATQQLVAAALRLNAEERDRFPQQHVYFFTDLQRGTWLPDEVAAVELRERTAALAQQATLFAVDVGSLPTANLAVTDLRIAEPYVTVGADTTFVATLRQFGDEPRDGCVVELLIDDVPVGQQTVDVPADGQASVRLTHRFRDAGNHAVAVRATGDRLDVDNTRWLAVKVDQQVDVLCVAGSPDAALYVAAALDPDRADGSPIRTRTITEGDLTETELAPFDAVFLCNVAQLTPDEAERLARFVQQGGGLAVFVGDRVVRDSYNALVDDSGNSILVARLGEVVTATQLALDPLDYQHPIVAPFRGRERAGLLSTPIRRYVRLELPTATLRRQVDVALTTADGDPLIVTAPLGRGRTVLVATASSLTSFDSNTGEPWTTWPAWPSFLPIVREMLAYAVGGGRDQWQSMVGMPLTDVSAPVTTNEEIEIVRPDGRRASLRIATSRGSPRWSYGETDPSGIYAVRSNSSQPAEYFAVNVDTRESDLAQADPRNLPPELSIRRDGRGIDVAASGGIVPRAAWHRSLLWTALGLLFVELCLAWQFGRSAG